MHRPMSRLALTVTACLACSLALAQQPGGEQRAARYLESVRNQPGLLLDFLRDMPKGGDLHNHLTGAVYAESYIGFAAQDGTCVDRSTLALVPPPCDATGRVPAAQSETDPVLYRELIDAFSMRSFVLGRESAHDHFFDTFEKFDVAAHGHHPAMLAEVVSRAAAQHELYLELMTGPGRSGAMALGQKLQWTGDFAAMRDQLLAGGLSQAVAQGRHSLEEDSARFRTLLGCDTAQPAPACAVTVRYLYDALRAFPPSQVFAQLVLAFEIAKSDPRLVGVNLVQPEDDFVAMRDYDLHMRMMEYLHGAYPQVHISLHAGELAPGLVPPTGLKFHIREAVERGHAERIGHGVDVMLEDDAKGLLREMEQRHVAVEICLTSNDMILGVRDADHPFPQYLKYGVPVVLATDDEGVSRSEMTWEIKRAVESYHLTYSQLKMLERASLEHSFLPGANLWKAPGNFTAVAACAGAKAGSEPPPRPCSSFLSGSEKARLQWKLEGEFQRFESHF